jgi:hypothetical protein
MAQPIRIALWPGPRNISTAMMRAWGNRADPVVIDEPLYAYYLKMTGIEHPGAGARMPVATAGLGLFTQSNDKLI